MVVCRKLLQLLATDQNGIQEADGSIPFSSTRFRGVGAPQGPAVTPAGDVRQYFSLGTPQALD
jgi:hypothetical protein